MTDPHGFVRHCEELIHALAAERDRRKQRGESNARVAAVSRQMKAAQRVLDQYLTTGARPE